MLASAAAGELETEFAVNESSNAGIKHAVAKVGRVDILVSNAGIQTQARPFFRTYTAAAAAPPSKATGQFGS